MLTSLRAAEELYKPSPFWDKLAAQHIEELEKSGFENFKRTINLKYFNWGMLGIFAQHVLPLALWWLRFGRHNPTSAHILPSELGPQLYSGVLAKVYAVYVALLHGRVSWEDKDRALEKCVESDIGNPIRVALPDGRRTTQDLCNSIHEYLSAKRGTPLGAAPTILEIGAGYGRLASVFLQMEPGCKYWIVDIPPALYVSQRYLSEVFPDRRIFRFRPFADFAQVKEEVDSSDICFFMSDQIKLLPAKRCAATICISNLHEMTMAQIHHYFAEIDRLTKGVFYSKQWMRSIASENKFTISRDEYPVPKAWHCFFNERHPIQSWFFHSLYEITPEAR